MQDNASVPGVGDIAVFDGGSGTGNSVIAASTAIQGLECDGSTLGTGAYAGTLTHNGSVTLTINTGAANSLRFSSGMTYTPASTTSIVTLTHTAGTANILSNGKKFFALTINGAGGTTQLLDDLLVNFGNNAILTVTLGVFDANTHAISAVNFNSANSNVRSVILGGTVTLGGFNPVSTNLWNVSTAGTFTFTKNSANMVVLPGTAPGQYQFTGASLTYNDLTINASSAFNCLNITGGNTFAHLNIGSGWSIGFATSVTHTISNAFTWAGTQTAPIQITTNSLGTNATISCPSGACTLNWGILTGVNGTGGATFTATNTLQSNLAGNTVNTGWTISPPADATTTLTAAQITQLGKMIGAVAYGTVTTGASTTSVPTSAMSFLGVAASGVVADEFKGRTILFAGDTTTAGLRGASSAISANTASNTPTFTVATLPATPAAGDTFSVI